MSLRVLLADESASIRKVFQMGLQDFGAEVKSVHNGLDVIEVAQNFSPNIIFADILLQKKNGYEVCQEIQNHAELSNVPVILMWSSFMELDQQQYQNCGAQGELEKPFDVESMRGLIKKLVHNTQSQMISEFLNFPDSITTGFVEDQKKEEAQKNQELKATIPGQTVFSSETNEPEVAMELDGAETPDSNPEEVEESSVFNTQAEGDFNMYEVNTPTPPPVPETTAAESKQTAPENWAVQPLQNNQVEPTPTPTESEDNLEQFQSMDLNTDKKMDLNEFLYQPTSSQGVTPPPENSNSEHSETYAIQNVQIPNYGQSGEIGMTVEEKEAIIRSEVRAYLMGTLKEELPKLLEKIIKEELENIMKQELAIKGAPSQT